MCHIKEEMFEVHLNTFSELIFPLAIDRFSKIINKTVGEMNSVFDTYKKSILLLRRAINIEIPLLQLEFGL